MFSTVAEPTCIPTNRVEGFPFSTPSPAFVTCRIFNDSHSDQHEVIPHRSFDLCFSKLAMLNKVSCEYWLSVSLLGETSLGLLPVFNWFLLLLFLLLRCMSCSFILEIKPLLVTSFANIFSRSVDCLFILLMGLPRWLSSNKSPCNAGDAGSIPGSEYPLKEGMATRSSILVWRIQWRRRSLAGYSPWGRKELDMTEATEHACMVSFVVVKLESLIWSHLFIFVLISNAFRRRI